MKTSIVSVLLLSFLGLIWGTYLINGTSSYISSQKVMEEHARDIMENVASYAMEQTQNYLNRAQHATELTERLLRSQVLEDQKKEGLEKYFLDQLHIYPDISGIYFAAPNGEFLYVSRTESKGVQGYKTKLIQYDKNNKRSVSFVLRDMGRNEIKHYVEPADTYDPRQRPWFTGAVKKGGIFWSDPYIFYTSQKPGITISGPTFAEKGMLRGVVGVDIEIDELSTFIGELRIGERGKAVMINRNSDLVAFHDVSKIKYHDGEFGANSRLVKVAEFQDDLFSCAFEKLLPQKKVTDTDMLSSNSALFEYDSKRYQAMLMPFADPQWPWLIAMYFPEDDYLGALKENRNFNNIITLVMSVLATILALFLARSISKPIIELRAIADAITKGDSKSINLTTGFSEISTTVDTFSKLHIQLLKETEQRKEIEENLVQAEYEYTSLVENLNVAVFRTTLDGRVLRANRMCVQMLGVEGVEDIALNGALSVYENQEDRVEMLKELQIKGAVDDWQFRYKKINGDRGWASLCAQLQYDDNQRPLYLDGFIYDITEKRLSQECLIESERLAAVGILAGGVAHEFNNIYTGVLGYAELSLQDPEISEKTRSYLDHIRRFSMRTKDLTTNLLSFSAKKATGLRKSSLNTLVDETLALVEIEYRKENIIVEKSFAALPELVIDPAQISQVILNFLINARHALLKCPVKKVTIETGGDEQFTWLRITDTGCGIPKENISKIFTPFFSTKGEYAQGNSPQTQVKGTGLGLSVCDTIIKNHGGRIEIASAEGEGASFTLFLPHSEGEMPAEEEEKEAFIPTSQNGRILVLDDEEDIRDIVKFILESMDYEVVCCDDGHEAIEIVKQGGIDLLVADLQMPKMDGSECIEQIQQLHANLRPHILVLTGRLTESINTRLTDVDVNNIMTKPFEMAELQEKIIAIMGNDNGAEVSA